MKYPEGIREEKKKQEVKRNSQQHEAMVRVQREKVQSGWNEDKRFEGEGGVQGLHLRKGARLSSRGIPAGGVRGGSHSAGRCEISKKTGTQKGGKLQE